MTHLVAWFYMVKSAENEEIRRQIDAGVWNHVSVGFRYADLICDLCGRSYWNEVGEEGCRHVIGRVYGGRECTATYGGDPARVEAVEGSLVYLGCQHGAVMVKAEERDGTTETRRTRSGEGKGGRMSSDVREAAAAGSEAAAQERLERECEEARSARREAEEAIGKLQPLASDGELYRGDLREEIRRLAGIVGAEKEAAFLLDAVSDASATRLKELVAEYHRRADKLFPPQGLGAPSPAAPVRDPRAPRAHTVV